MAPTSLQPRPRKSSKASTALCLACIGRCRFDMPRELLYIRNALQQVLEAIWQEPKVVYSHIASAFGSAYT
jgi:hypothetical protein